jgi:Domain of unknown function (DUF4129)
MATEREPPTLADYIVLALNPLLIMLLVGSLIYFLLDVCYAGAYGADIRWTLFFFIAAVVLITRISMTSGISERSGCYAVVLGFAVWLAMQKYIAYPTDGPGEALRAVINLGLIALVWWCAHRLTWDCTFESDEVDNGGKGLLEAAGLEGPALPAAALAEPETPSDKPAKPLGWVERYRRYRDERKKKRSRGAWVIYFSLAALPLFGLGQSLIPSDAEDRRRYAFWLMTMYVGSGLGLLLTTSFLGMRRYLRQRKLKMPPALAGVWLTSGALLILVLLVLGAFLPRPHSEYPLIHFKPLGSDDLDASDYAMRGENAGKDKGRPGGDPKEDEEKDKDSQAKDRSEKDGKDKDGDDKDKDDKDKDGKDKDDKDKDGKNKDGNKKDKAGNSGKSDKDKPGGKKRSSGRTSRSSSSSGWLSSWLGSVGTFLKWLVFAVVALIVLFVLLRNGLKFLSNFLDWARRLLESLRNFFAGLFGGQKRAASKDDDAEDRKTAEQPFASFHNPFHDGRAGQMSVKELLCYSFAALQAWARERGHPRYVGETPSEFAVRLGGELPAVEAPVRRLTNLFIRAVYAPEVLPETCRELIEAFWEQLETAARPLAAV